MRCTVTSRTYLRKRTRKYDLPFDERSFCVATNEEPKLPQIPFRVAIEIRDTFRKIVDVSLISIYTAYLNIYRVYHVNPIVSQIFLKVVQKPLRIYRRVSQLFCNKSIPLCTGTSRYNGYLRLLWRCIERLLSIIKTAVCIDYIDKSAMAGFVHPATYNRSIRLFG